MTCLGAGIALAPTASAAQKCPAQGAFRIEINSGPTACSQAYGVATKFDQNQQRQQVGQFVCESKNAMQRGSTGLLFSCCTGKLTGSCQASQGEFSVYQA